MGRNRVVLPEMVRLPLSDGDFIDVKKRLNTGEQRELFSRMVPTIEAGEKAQLNTLQVGLSKIVAYLVGWSLTGQDRDGKEAPVPYSMNLPIGTRESTINSLDTDTYNELLRVIDTHEEAQDALVAQEKNVKAGQNVPVLT